MHGSMIFASTNFFSFFYRRFAGKHAFAKNSRQQIQEAQGKNKDSKNSDRISNIRLMDPSVNMPIGTQPILYLHEEPH